MKIKNCDIYGFLVGWYAVDKNGYIFCGESLGTCVLPEFVIRDYANGAKEHRLLEDFFYNFESFNLENKKFIKELDENIVSEELKKIFKNVEDNEYLDFLDGYIIDALQGITPFNLITDETIIDLFNRPYLKKIYKEPPWEYIKMINPTDILNTKLLHFDQLPENIKKLMDSRRMNIDVQKEDHFKVPHCHLCNNLFYIPSV